MAKESFWNNLNPAKTKNIKTPTILQMEAVECGAVSLAIILSYYGLVIPIEELRIKCGVTRDGSKASNIIKAGREFGLDSKGYQCEVEGLENIRLPAVVYWEFNHFLVLERIDKDKVYLNDPAFGRRTVTTSEFNKSYTGVALEFVPTKVFKPYGRRVGLFGRLWPRIAPLKSPLGLVFLASTLLVIPSLLIPTILKIFIDEYLVSGHSDWIRPLLLCATITAILKGLLTWIQHKQLSLMHNSLFLNMSAKYIWHILRLPHAFFQQRYAGEIVQRMNSNSKISELVSGEFAINLANLLIVVFYAILMFQYDLLLGLVGALSGFIIFLVLRRTSSVHRDGNLRIQLEQGRLFSTTLSGIQNIETIKATGSESEFFSKWTGHRIKLLNTCQEIGVKLKLLDSLPALLEGLGTVIVIGYGSYLVMLGSLTVGSLVAFLTLFSSFMLPVNKLVELSGRIQSIEADLTRLDDVLSYPVDKATEVQITKPKSEILHGRLEMKDICFGYNPLDPPLITEFNLSLYPGKVVAIVGGSGSGKSTIAKLIAGLNVPWSGEILFDGVARERISRKKLACSVSYVEQDVYLFTGSVRDNLCLWDYTVPEKHIIQAAQDAMIHDVISLRTGGYDSPVNERGTNFSGGEAQRLEIARALVSNPGLLILDEATAALDPVTEKLIYESIRRRGCSCVVIAHRLSAIKDVDEIIVLDNGSIVQRGTHDQLRSVDGLYSRLVLSI